MVLKQQLCCSIQRINNNVEFIINLQMVSSNGVSLYVNGLFCYRLLQKSILFLLYFRQIRVLLIVVYEDINDSYGNKNYKYAITILNDKLQIIKSMEGTVTRSQGNTTKLERFQATMVLAAVGDAIGYRGGSWQFTFDGVLIHQELMEITKGEGIKGLYIQRDGFPYSDDTVMHIATAQALIQSQPGQQCDKICVKLAKHYKACMRKMTGRAPGGTCIRSANKLRQDGQNWKDIQFQKHGGGCGASMRAACIGLYLYNDPYKLISVSIESGRITHHNPLGYLGALVAAFFTSFAINAVSPQDWLELLMKNYLAVARNYVASAKRNVKQNLTSGDWDLFVQRLTKYGEIRAILREKNGPIFPIEYGVNQREKQYKLFSVNEWPGALGLDSVIIAYDALLSTLDYEKRQKEKGLSVNKWEEVCLRGMLHGGDSDSTGTIVGAWYGALYGYKDVYESNYAHSEKKEFIESLGTKIYQMVYDGQPKK